MTGRGTYWGLEHPDRVILADDFGRSLTNAELHSAALHTAAALAGRGVSTGTVVSWQLPTTLEAMVVMVALARLGAVQNPILPIWRESEVGFVTSQLATEVLIVPGVWRGFDHVVLADDLARERAMGIEVVDHAVPIADGLRLPVGDPETLLPPPASAEEARWVYYSSGTTAAPKGVRHCDRSVIAGSAGVVGMVGASSADVNPIAFPVTHIGGAAMLVAFITGLFLLAVAGAIQRFWGFTLSLADGRLLITFRDTHPASPTNGDRVAWVGTLDDLVNGREGQFTCRLVDHRGAPLAASPLRAAPRV